MRFFTALGVLFAAAPASVCTLVVRPGHSIQAEVNRGQLRVLPQFDRREGGSR